MAGLEVLTSVIYHEKQQQGSALCAQHALNNLLQGSYFTAPDLSDIARNLDLLEESYSQGIARGDSMNMDDSGFFSIQVIENALKVWGLNLMRWRGENMRPYHDRPYTQLAFILNLEQHWFTLRRFGDANPNVDRDSGNGHWFNLNSFHKKPEWVSRLYLGMVLQQAETEGYSVFAVVQADPSEPLALPRTDADSVASTLPEPSSSSFSPNAPVFQRNEEDPELFEKEDYELQAVLQASLTSPEHHLLHTLEGAGPSVLQPPVVDAPSSSLRTQSSAVHHPGQADIDPVATSMERNQAMLQRMREQQEFAHREMWSYVTEGMTPEEITAEEVRRENRRRQEEEEEEELQRALAESEAMAIAANYGSNSRAVRSNGDVHHNSSSMDTRASYDDEDVELQAALKASLEYPQNGTQSLENIQSIDQIPKTSGIDDSRISLDTESVPSGDTYSLDTPSSSEAPSLDEIRRKRLAKFGGGNAKCVDE
ncbi:hypothetical protein AX17_004611 [Amanita inopinata Kibby_2008]|nr:hypothetical protein AX17_004611 [Amanita inopinata Kibby_2008]